MSSESASPTSDTTTVEPAQGRDDSKAAEPQGRSHSPASPSQERERSHSPDSPSQGRSRSPNGSRSPRSPTAMAGKGFYNANASFQARASQPILPLLSKAVENLGVTLEQLTSGDGSVCYVVDYGAAHGLNSQPIFNTLIPVLRAKYNSPNLPIVVSHEDQPGNDWGDLFQTVGSVISVVSQHPNVFVNAVGQSFFTQCYPPGSLTLGYSSTSFHWMSKTESDRTGKPWCFGSEEAQQAAKQQAREDWRTILKHRSAELKKGGILCCVEALAMDEAERIQQQVAIGNRNVICSISKLLWEAFEEMVEAKEATQDELLSMTFPLYPRSHEELTDAEILRECGLEEVTACTKKYPPGYGDTMAMLKSKDLGLVATVITGSFRGWSEGLVQQAVTGTPEEKIAKVELFFGRIRAKIQREPAHILKALSLNVNAIFLVLRKL